MIAELEWTSQHTFVSVVGSAIVALITVLATKGVDAVIRYRKAMIEVQRDALAVEIENDDRLPPGIKAMVKLLNDSIAHLQDDVKALRLEHEKCLQDHATAVAESAAIRRELSTLSQKHDNLKRRVGGSDVSELMPPEHDRKRKP